jgi:hypothetical protein
LRTFLTDERHAFSNWIKKYPIEIALFAAKHEYSELLKLTAGYAVKLPLSTVVPLLPERLVLPWVSHTIRGLVDCGLN